MQVTTIGLDIAKNVFQVHGIDASEKVVVRKQLRRSQVLELFKALPPCLIGMEACASAHYWARELTKLGHKVGLMPARDVKAYVKRNKDDAADAEAICEAVRRPTMRFVQVKSAEQQSQLMLHRTRDLLMRQRTQVINALRAHMLASLCWAKLVQKVSGMPLDQYAQTYIFGPLSMTSTRFNPPPTWVPRIAPTQRDEHTGQVLRGTVHDPTARRMGGVAGDAGLFSNADDVAKFARSHVEWRCARFCRR